MGLLRRPTPGGIVEDGRLGRPCGPGALRAQLEKTSLRLRRHSHISNISPIATYRHLMERDANSLEAIIVGNDPWWFGVPGRCCIHPAAIGEEDSMGSDHHSLLMDVPPVPLGVAGRRSGWCRSWRLARSAACGWTTTSGAGRCAGHLSGSGCDE